MNPQSSAVTKKSNPHQGLEAVVITENEPSIGSQSDRKRAGTEKYKIQIQLSEKAKDRLFELVEKTEAESAAQVVRDALRIYDILIDETGEKGRDLFLRDGASGEVVRLKLF